MFRAAPLTALMLAALATTAAAQTQPAAPPAVSQPPYRFSGLVFGDYYGFLDHHLPEWEGQQGFWFRRIYFTYDHTLSPKLAVRLRLEMNSNGKLAGGNLNAYVKDASLNWTFAGRQSVTLGMHPSLAIDFPDTVWGLRHIEKTPLDFYRIDASRDTGVSLGGPLNDRGSLSYQVQYGNESGTGSEVDEFKAVRAALRYSRDPGWAVELMVGRYGRAETSDSTVGQLIAAYRFPAGRAAIHYAYQRFAGEALPLQDHLQILSGFGVYDVKPKQLSLFARVDRVFDPCPRCGGNDYLPIDPTAPFVVTIAGLEYYVHPAVRLSPNVQYVAYGTSAIQTNLRNDAVLRLTFYWVW